MHARGSLLEHSNMASQRQACTFCGAVQVSLPDVSLLEAASVRQVLHAVRGELHEIERLWHNLPAAEDTTNVPDLRLRWLGKRLVCTDDVVVCWNW